MLRKTFFGNTPTIWYTYIPESDAVLLIVDAIELARLDEDLVKYV